MNKYAFLLLVSFVLLLSSCKKIAVKVKDNRFADAFALEDATIIKQGNFSFKERQSQGIAKIYLQKNYRYTIGLENMNFKQTSEFYVYLSANASLPSASLKLYGTVSIVGNQYYTLPPGFNISVFNFVLLQDDKLNKTIASAPLN